MEFFMSNLLSILEKNYKIEKEIGRGGMGTVYLALDKRLNRQVAIKVLALASENEDQFSLEEVILRFKREAKSIAMLSHPNIVTIYDIGEEDNKYYMVMEYLEGKPLSQLLEEKKRLPPVLAINIGIQISNALNYAHENGIIHRDIKPANIILSRLGTAKLTDFGIAQFNKEQIKITQAGALLGSFMYIPPEQLEDSANVDHRVDIYSLGITLYELISGVLPFEADSVSQYFLKILSEKPRKLSSFNTDIPPGIDEIIEKALFKTAGGRYQTAKELSEDLVKVLLNKQFFRNSQSLFFTEEMSNRLFDGVIVEETTHEKVNHGITNIGLRKKIIDNTINRILKNNYSWINEVMENWESGQINIQTREQLLEKIIASQFTGTLIIDENIYAFVCGGFFVGALDIENDLKGDKVFQNIPEKPYKVEVKIPDDDKMFTTLILPAILDGTGELVHKNLGSNSFDLLSIIGKPFSGYFSCYTETNTFYYGFYNGDLLFAVPLNKTDDKNYLDIKKMANNASSIFNAYKIQPVLAGPTVLNLLKNSTITVKFKNEKVHLYNIISVGDDEIPVKIIRELKKTTSLSLNLNQPDEIILMGNELHLAKIVKNSEYYHFAEWLVNEYFFLLNSESTSTSLKYIYHWIGGLERINFFESLPGEDGNYYNFSLVFHGELSSEINEKVLLLIRFGNGSIGEVDQFFDDCIHVKKKFLKEGDIGGTLYVSSEEYSPETIKLFNERTAEPRKVFNIGASEKQNTGFVRMGYGKGFNLILLEQKVGENSFKVIAPQV
jgi:serine/threonine protein kinase